MYYLLLLYISTQTETTRKKAKQVLVDCIVTYIISREGGWEILDQLRILIDSVVEEPKSEKKYNAPHYAISFDGCFASLLYDVLLQLKDQMSSNKPKRKDPVGSVYFEGFSLSTYFIMCYCLGLTPAAPRRMEIGQDDSIQSDYPTTLLEVNMIDTPKMQLLVMAVDFWDDLLPQVTSATDNCLADSSRHMNTPLMLCRKYVNGMKGRGCGYILNISSLAAWMDWPAIGMYGNTKRFVKDYSRELRIECQKTGVSVTNAYFGAVDTPLVPLRDDLRKLARGLTVMIRPEKAVDKALSATFHRRKGTMPGFVNWLFWPFIVILPEWLLGWIYRKAKKYLKPV